MPHNLYMEQGRCWDKGQMDSCISWGYLSRVWAA